MNELDVLRERLERYRSYRVGGYRMRNLKERIRRLEE